MRRGGGFKSIGELAAPLHRAIAGEKAILREAEKTFSMALSATRLTLRGECVTIHPGGRAARVAFSGMEEEILSWLQSKGLSKAKKITWSAGSLGKR